MTLSSCGNRLRQWLFRHSGAFVLAALSAAIVNMPVLLFPSLAGPSYQGANIAHFGTDEHYYLTRAKEILEGHGLGNIVLREGKDAQEPQFTFVEYALLLPVKALGLAERVDVVALYNAYNFAGVFVLFLLIYFFSLELQSDRRFAAAAGLLVIAGYSMVYNKTVGSPELNIYGRAIFPFTSSIAFFLFLRALYRSLFAASSRRAAMVAGVLFGVLFYVFFFCWSFALALLGALFFTYLAIFRKREQAKQVALVAAIGLLLGGYNMIRILSFYATEHGRQLSFFLWSYETRLPIFSAIGFAMLILAAYYWYRHRSDARIPWIFSCILAGWVALNQQVVTGRVIQYGHYYWFFIVPLSLILAWYMLWNLLPRTAWRNSAAIFLGSLSIVNAVVGQYRVTQLSLPVKLEEQAYRPLISLLAEEPAPGVVAAPDGWPGLLVTIYTDHDLLWNTTALVYNTPPERLEDMVVWCLYVEKEARSLGARAFLEQSLADAGNDCSAIYRAIEGVASGWDSHVYDRHAGERSDALLSLRKKTIDRIVAAYDAFLADPESARRFVVETGLTHVLWDESKNPSWNIAAIADLELVSRSGAISLYRVGRK